VRRIGRRHEQHAVEGKPFHGGAGDGYMSAMDGVECASEQSESQPFIMRYREKPTRNSNWASLV